MKKKASKAKSAKATKRTSAKRSAKRPAKGLQLQLPAKASAADRREAAHFVETLDANMQLSREPGPLPPGATHQVERDKSGNKRLVRKRYSAL